MNTLIGPCALNFAGLVSWYDRTGMVTTSHSQYNGMCVFNCYVYYLPDIDSDNDYLRDTIITMYAPARRPTKERSLIDYMRHLDIFEEFYFVEGLREYVDQTPDLSLLREVAERYGVLPQLEEWLIEIEDRSDCE